MLVPSKHSPLSAGPNRIQFADQYRVFVLIIINYGMHCPDELWMGSQANKVSTSFILIFSLSPSYLFLLEGTKSVPEVKSTKSSCKLWMKLTMTIKVPRQ